ncbi:hypothetical protein [Lysobacter gummosus]|uniref:hypothetical protein n=1 Tax=Lysobacter gummosus TaxID=262324 RepID=UPI00363C0E12
MERCGWAAVPGENRVVPEAGRFSLRGGNVLVHRQISPRSLLPAARCLANGQHTIGADRFRIAA